MFSKIKEVFGKITGASVVDEKLVKEVIKEMQRVLISSDVNIKLVQEISNEIKKEALSQTLPPGFSRKEHLTKVVYDKLIQILGGKEYKPRIEPHKILLVGLYGSGKCVHPNTLIPFGDGSIKTIKEAYNEVRSKKKESRERGGFKLELDGELIVNSMDTDSLQIVPGEVETFWKLKSPKWLYEVFFDNGNDQKIIVTPEHPFYVLEEGLVKERRADQLGRGVFVALPSASSYKPQKVNLLKELSKLYKLQVKSAGLGEKVKKLMKRADGSVIKFCRNNGIKMNYSRLTTNLKQDWVPLEVIDKLNVKLNFKKPKFRAFNASKKFVFTFPSVLNEDLSEFVGYVIGDGHLDKRYIQITSQNKEVIKRISYLSEKLFSISSAVTKVKGSKNLRDIKLSSKGLVEVMNKVFNIPIGKKGTELKIPPLILSSSKSILKSFIKAYFDCDSSSSKEEREIELCSESRILVKQIQLALLNYNITSSVSKKKINEKYYYRLFIRGRSAETYAREFSSIIKHKKNKLSKFKHYGKEQGDNKQLMIPVGNLLKKAREATGLSIGYLQDKGVNSYGKYERKGFISLTNLRKTLKIMKRANSKGWLTILNALQSEKTYKELLKITNLSKAYLNAELFRLQQLKYISKKSSTHGKYAVTSKGKKIINSSSLKKDYLNQLSLLAGSDVFWSKVNCIKKIKSDTNYVYDLTVKKHHNFTAEGVIVHNTTTAAKLAKFYMKRGLKPALITTDTWRPAAYEQLKQIGSQINVPAYGNPKEKNALKILKQALGQAKNSNLMIVDSAGRDSLNDELIDEIKQIKKELKPDEVFLVISSDIGQTAVKQAREFNKAVGLTGVIATKADASGKAGGALSACYIAKVPVAFIGTGEKLNDFEVFNAEKFIGRLLGVPDIGSLIEKMKEAVEETEFNPEDLMKGNYDLNAFYKQLEATKKMGSMKKILEMLGLGGAATAGLAEQSEEKMKKFKVILESMTKYEKAHPNEIKSSRIKRIAKGSGTIEKEVKELLKQFEAGKKMIKKFKKGKLKNVNQLMKKFQAGGLKL